MFQTASSIVLTTLAAKYYRGEQSVFLATQTILDQIASAIPQDGSILEVLNPAHEEENLADRWQNDQVAYAAFICKMQELRARWHDLGTLSLTGGLADTLSSLFESAAPRRVLAAQAVGMNKLKQSKLLGVSRSTGRLTIPGAAGVTEIRPNRHFGGAIRRK